MPVEKLIELLSAMNGAIALKRSPRGKYIHVSGKEIAHHLKELEVYKRALELACRELELRERKMYMITAISASIFEKELLKAARDQKRREGINDD